jgi:glycogen debranching enzyme
VSRRLPEPREGAGTASGVSGGLGGPRRRKRRILHQARSTLVADLGGTLTTKSGVVFALCTADGDIDLSRNPGHGIYFHDMRYLDTAVMRLNQAPLSVLLADANGRCSVCELTNADIQLRSGRMLPKERIGIRRERTLGDPVRETVVLRSYAARELDFDFEIELGCSFDSMFTVRGAPPGKRGRLHRPRWKAGRLLLEYAGADQRRRTTSIGFDPPPDEHHAGKVLYRVQLAPGESATIRIDTHLLDEGRGQLEERPAGAPDSQPLQTVNLTTDNDLFNRVLARSFDDLRMLLMSERKHLFFAAGVPWFVALFGRDSLLTALEILPYDASVSAHTLRLLAAYQGDRQDDSRDEQPGKILHELRAGEQAHLKEVPQSPYYGTVDATPLFLVLLGEYVRWTGDLGLFHELRDNVRRALAWIDGQGDSDGDGFVDYTTRSKQGFRNQGWKDSGNSIVNSDGSVAEPPIALVEVQGYVYRGKSSLATVARASGDSAWAEKLEAEADDLRRRFRDAFWSPELGYLALALQEGGRRAEAVASNAGQALWTGIVSPEHVDGIAGNLLGDALFSGWGVRTLASTEAAYNPIDYQVGSVWPHDTAMIMAGLKGCGRDAEAGRVFTGLFEAAARFPHYRLPEVFAGFSRQDHPVPVRYPVACNPQAWAAASIPFMLASALGLEPNALEGRLEIARPALPPWLSEVTVRGLRVGQATIDLRYRRVGDDTLVAVLGRTGDVDVVVTF